MKIRHVYVWYPKSEVDRGEAWELTRAQQIPGAPWALEDRNPWRRGPHQEHFWVYMRGQIVPDSA